jgi:hypothetical protein
MNNVERRCTKCKKLQSWDDSGFCNKCKFETGMIRLKENENQLNQTKTNNNETKKRRMEK